jgi:hypothetical protein
MANIIAIRAQLDLAKAEEPSRPESWQVSENPRC